MPFSTIIVQTMDKYCIQNQETKKWTTKGQLVSKHQGQKITVHSVQRNGNEGKPFCDVPSESISGKMQHASSQRASLNHSQHSIKSAFYGIFLGWKDWKGRSTRREHWNCWLGFIAFSVILFTLFMNIDDFDKHIWVYFCVLGLLSISVFACSVRRLHDIGHSGWWIIFFACVPVYPLILPLFIDEHPDKTTACILGTIPTIVLPACFILSIVLMLADSQAGRNKYGISQKYPFTDEEVKEMNERRISPRKYLPIHLMHNKTAGTLNSNHLTSGKKDMKYCSKCGTKLAADAQFCSACGNKLA